MQRPNLDQLKPTGDWLLVKPVLLPEVTTGGIVMPTANRSAEAYGIVHKTGPGFWQNGVLVAPDVQVGDTILFRKGRGLEMRFDGEHVLFMTMRDLLAVVNQ
jgi:chaperonin GroES